MTAFTLQVRVPLGDTSVINAGKAHVDSCPNWMIGGVSILPDTFGTKSRVGMVNV
ncbi:hypothetical protein D3C76_1641550 [compost metagenome]